MKLKNVFAMFLTTCSLFATGCSSSTTKGDVLDNIVSSKKLIVGTEATYVPFEYTDTNGNIIGYDVDVVKLVEEKIESKYNIDLTVEWKDMSFDGLVGALQTNKVNLVAAAMTITEDRAKEVNFSDSYFEAATAVLKKKDNTKITDMDSLKAAKCGAQLGTVQADYIVADGWNKSNMTVTSVADLSLALQAGTIDALVVETPVANAIKAKYTDFELVPNIDFNDSASFGLASQKTGSDSFIALINEVLSDAKASGKLDEIYTEAVNKAQ